METERSNILFESNIYPIKGDIVSDDAFLSKVFDYNRLKSLQKRYGQIPALSMHQRRVIQETPYCSLNQEDPCYGMVKMGGKYEWLCMCTKTDCPYFTECRKALPFDPIAEKEFVPEAVTQDEYGYRHFLSTYKANPLLIGDCVEYGRTMSGVYKVSVDEVKQESPFKKLLTTEFTQDKPQVPDFEGSETKYHLECPTHDVSRSQVVHGESEFVMEDTPKNDQLPEKKQNIEISAQMEQSNSGKKTREQSTKAGRVAAEPQVDLADPGLNIFEFFKECKQEEIIEADSRELFFVDAGPGTGKTYTLIQKLNYMVSEEGVDAEGIMVLCFTNAAVDEIKIRLKQFVSDGADRSLINIDVRTFHSFAWWLINQANELFTDSGWNAVNIRNQTFETSLIKAGDAISQFGADIVSGWEHFIVDEVQDLTNTLGRFVLKIVNACIQSGCGITVLGDACQAIYDYDQETTYSLKSIDFYRALFSQMYGRAKFVSLTENHRQGTSLIDLTSGLREAILTENIKNMRHAVDDLLLHVDKTGAELGSFSDALREDSRHGKTVSLLLRNNGQTLKMSSDLRKRGIDHVLNVSETRNNFAPWIADIFATYAKPNISEDKFQDLYEESTGESGELIWRRLQKLLHTDNDVLSIREILNAIATSKIDDPLLRTLHNSNVIVSNIHRSKGREYDDVVVDQGFLERAAAESKPDEFKTLYVAITRPRNRLIASHLDQKGKIQTIHIFDTNEYRWGRKKGRKLAYLEFKSALDISCEMFAGIDQDVFFDIAVGDPITLKRKLRNGGISYAIFDENAEIEIGTLAQGNSYIQNLQSYMQISDSSLVEMPSTITDLYISGIYSQVVDEEYLEKHPDIQKVASNGVWKWVELVGLGHADYDVY